jgi:pimeloyl-ACP methyl ester carboxylesterase
MSTFILVHGAWLGAWCWDRVAAELKSAGHTIQTPELPGHGQDKSPVSGVTLDSYVDTVTSEIGKAQEKIVLVGHSMAGIVISQVAERMPERISCLIYASAYLLEDGQAIVKASEIAVDSLVGPSMVPAPDWSTISIKAEALKDVFAADAPPEELKRLQSFARPEPAGPFNTPIHVTAGCFGSVRRCYIKTAKDRAVTPLLQDALLAKTPCAEVATLNTSHTPFLAAPAEMAKALISLAKA